MSSKSDQQANAPAKWGKIIDHNRCIGCHACTVACKQEHDIPIGVTRTYVKQVEVGVFPKVRRHFQVNRCNQCDASPCVAICPTSAMYRRSDGIVDFHRGKCIGCKACIAACPYDAIYIDPKSHSAEKCNFCAHRIDRGFQPACVTVCPTQAISVGNLNDPQSLVSQCIGREKAQVRKPEKGTTPKIFYIDASGFTLTPGEATYTHGFLHAQPQDLAVTLGDNHSTGAQTNRAPSGGMATVVYGSPQKAPWDWRVSMYTWTKSVASGGFLSAAVLGVAGLQMGRGFEATVSLVSLVFLALTALLLIWDLSHPMRFMYAVIKPQPKSWLVWGSYLITAYTGLLGLFLLALALDIQGLIQALRWVGIFLAAGTGGYTAFLFGQAKGRDLWQEPGLPLHLLVQMGVAGASVLILISQGIDATEEFSTALRWIFLGTLVIHLLLSVGQIIMPHSTADGARAGFNMVWGRYRTFYWSGIIGGALVPLALLLFSTVAGPVASVGAALALAGLAFYEHAYVQAGQSVPLS